MSDTPRAETVADCQSSYADCDVYVDSDDRDDLRDLLMAIAPERPVRQSEIAFDGLSVRIAHNDYETGGEGNFLQWSTVLECAATPDAAPREIVASVQSILSALKSAGIRALPSCEFEDELNS